MHEIVNNVVNSLSNSLPTIIIVIAIIIGVVRIVIQYSKMTKEERVNAALKVIKEELLKLMSDAEIEWEDYKKSGELKKSQVLKEIYSQFPFLATYIDQDTLVNKLYELIDNEMENMNKIINNTTTDKKE